MQKYVRIALIFLLCFTFSVSLISARAKTYTLINKTTNDLESQSFILTSTLHDNFLELETKFPKPTVSYSFGQHSVSIQDFNKHIAPGEPVLPIKTIKVLLPMDKNVHSISVTTGSSKMLDGDFIIEYGKTPVPIGQKPIVQDEPNSIIYDSSEPFPGKLYTQLSEQYLRGYRILLLELHPVQYLPKLGKLLYYDTLYVNIQLGEQEPTLLLRDLPTDRILVQSMVDNPEVLTTYSKTSLENPRSSIVNPAESYDYVIITNELLNSSFQPLVNQKVAKGLNVTRVMVDSILNEPEYFCDGAFGDGCGSKFNDTAARIRNFIKDAYANWETEYVLLGGDVQVTGYRGVYGFVGTNPPEVDRNMPCDMYFGALDGSWDNDNDTIFGEGLHTNPDNPENGTEGEELDWYGEVYIGRAPVTTVEQVQNFVNKTLWYTQETDIEYFKKALFIAEELDEETQAANSKDDASDEAPQYTTTRLYDRDGTYSGAAVLEKINEGTHILNHDGHTNAQTMMDLSILEVDTLLTNTEYFFGYSVGCHAGAFQTDSVVEHFVYGPNGSFAFIANSRYGWYYIGMIGGPGDKFDKEFFKIINTDNHIGKTLQLSKETFAGPVEGSTRWTYVELNLFGDPELELVTDLVAPTAHFNTYPDADRLTPAVIKGVVNLTGYAKRGTALGATFVNYTIEFFTGGEWKTDGITLVNGGLSEISKDILATWDTNQISPKTVRLRLTVKDATGVIGEDIWIVRIEELPAIRAIPETTNTLAGLTFTISIEITDAEDLFGIDFVMEWNTTLLDYVSHELYIPVETYWWGVLHDPVTINNNEINVTAGTCWINATSTSWTAFEGDGTVCNMTLYAKTNGTSILDFIASNLTNRDGETLNFKVKNGTVEIGPGVYDIAIIDLQPRSRVFGEGTEGSRINITISNEGTFPATFNCTIYANGTEVDVDEATIDGLQTETMVISWNLTGWSKGNYSLTAIVDTIPNENDTVDNTMDDGWVFITIPGDVNADRKVDIYDIVEMAAIYGDTIDDPSYKPHCDLDGDGDIDIYDIVAAAGHYGESW